MLPSTIPRSFRNLSLLPSVSPSSLEIRMIPLPLHLYVRGDHVQITLQSINILLVKCPCCPLSPLPRWRSGWSPSPPPPRPGRSCLDYPAINQCIISASVPISVAEPGCLSRIPDPDFFASRILDLGSRISDPGSRIPDPKNPKTEEGKK